MSRCFWKCNGRERHFLLFTQAHRWNDLFWANLLLSRKKSQGCARRKTRSTVIDFRGHLRNKHTTARLILTRSDFIIIHGDILAYRCQYVDYGRLGLILDLLYTFPRISRFDCSFQRDNGGHVSLSLPAFSTLCGYCEGIAALIFVAFRWVSN